MILISVLYQNFPTSRILELSPHGLIPSTTYQPCHNTWYGVLIFSLVPPCETSKTFGIQIVVTQNGNEISGTPDLAI